MTVRILQGDCREVMATMPANIFDAIVTDPPYHLTTGKKGGSGAASDNPNSPAGRARISTGFMGKAWDGGDVAFDPATWAQALRVLKPGGMLVAFGGTRTYHRLACAIEDGGFEIRDMLAWLYGSGFPKATDKAKIPEEWKGWNTALKPAFEPIAFARKPMEGTLAENLTKWGTGALYIDGCRVSVDDETDDPRWPANLMHDGSEEVLAVFPDTPGQIADCSSSSSRKTQNVYGAMRRGNGRDDEPSADGANEGTVGFKVKPGARRGDEGSAARFFYCAKASTHDRNDGCIGLPEQTSGMGSNTSGQHITRRDGGAPGPRANHHPTVKPTDLMRWLCRLVTPPGGKLLDPFLGSGSTLKAAELEGFDAAGIERDPAYVAIARGRIASDAPLFAEVA